jgi:hypothetical protein
VRRPVLHMPSPRPEAVLVLLAGADDIYRDRFGAEPICAVLSALGMKSRRLGAIPPVVDQRFAAANSLVYQGLGGGSRPHALLWTSRMLWTSRHKFASPTRSVKHRDASDRARQGIIAHLHTDALRS